jgi:DNA-binding response OmpR family regulator
MSERRILVVDDHLELAELLAAALENEGMRAIVALTGAEALSEAESDPPALAIVDLVLPDMLGTDLLDALARLDPPVPTVAMSGVFRGERYLRETTERHGARRFFEKPFSTDTMVKALIEVLGEIAGPSAGGEDETPPAGESEPSEDPFEVDLSETVHADTSQETEIFPDAATVLGDETRDDLKAPKPAPHPGRERQRRLGFVEDLIEVPTGPGEGAPAEAAAGADGPDPAAPAALPVRPRRSRQAPVRVVASPARGGEIGPTTAPRLLAAFFQAGSTGALELRREKVAKVIYLRDGQPTFAGSNLGGDRLLTFAVNRQAIRREDAESALALAKEGGRRIGEILIELGVLDRKSLQKLVRDQVRAIIWSTFSWREGRYAVRPHKEGRREPVTLNLPLGRLIIDGMARAVPLLVLRDDVPDAIFLTPRQAPVVPIQDLNLRPEEARLLAAADGTKTVEDLLALSDQEERPSRALLRALWDLDVLGPREQVEARSRRIGFVV